MLKKKSSRPLPETLKMVGMNVAAIANPFGFDVEQKVEFHFEMKRYNN